MASPHNQTFQPDFWLHLLIIKITRGPSHRTNDTNSAQNAAASALMVTPSWEREHGCERGWGFPLAACSFLLLYEMPLAEIDKMLDLIKKNSNKDAREHFLSPLQRTATNISSHFSFQRFLPEAKGFWVITVCLLVWLQRLSEEEMRSRSV